MSNTIITVTTSKGDVKNKIKLKSSSLEDSDSFDSGEILRCSSCENIHNTEDGVPCKNCSAVTHIEDDVNASNITSTSCCCKCHHNDSHENKNIKTPLSISCGDDTILNAKLSSPCKVETQLSSPNRSITSEKLCRICLDDESQGTLIAPCKCTGSTKYAHEECLLKWFFKSSNKSCEVCLGTVNVTPIGYKPVQEWRLPERGCDFIVYLFGLYFIIMIIFTGMITWIATQKCTSPVCVTLYVVCGVALIYFFYCCGCVEYSRRYWSSLLSVNRVWRIYGREDSIRSLPFNTKANKKQTVGPDNNADQIHEPYVITIKDDKTTNSLNVAASLQPSNNESNVTANPDILKYPTKNLSVSTSSDTNLGYDNPSIVIIDEH